MKAAIVRAAGQPPIYENFPEPQPASDERHIRVTAASISQVVRSRAAGTHYSSTEEFPFVVGVDGVGRLDDGSRVYFALPRPPYGTMAEQTVVPAGQCLPLPDDLDDITAAAIANPGMSSWAAFSRSRPLRSAPMEYGLVDSLRGVHASCRAQRFHRLQTPEHSELPTAESSCGTRETTEREGFCGS
jgi:NADPH:quinone reductase-like Zn-dependent oxidoreductase